MAIITVRFSDGTIERKDSDYVSKRSDGVLCSLRLEPGTGATILEPCEQVIRYGCPKGHTEKIQESFRCWVWFPVDPESGDTDTTHGNEEFDEDSWCSNHIYFCPTCNDTFSELNEIE